MNCTTALTLTLALSSGALCACDKASDDAPEAEAEVDENPAIADFEATCTVTESSRSLGVVVLRDPEQRCTVFVPEPVESGELSVALRPDAQRRNVAAELVNDSDERLFATDGEATISLDGGRITGHLDARDQNSPAVGRLRIAIDAPAP